MNNPLSSVKANFGTLPVFLTAISTILGAIMFLRFGFAVGSVGFTGTLLIIFIGHLVTISTAMALAEIATNQKVEGGGEYFIISRSTQNYTIIRFENFFWGSPVYIVV